MSTNDDAPPIGIDAMAFSGPECYVDMRDLAQARGVDPAKYVQGLGQTEMAVATPCEDTVTMAAVAARRALDAFDVDPAEIGTLIVGTETGIDHSKPVAVYVHDLLGLFPNCRTFETKHACYGAMAGLTSAMDWIAAGRARGKKALIIASDIARYGVATPGEPTQGAGAVAMVVSRSPRLVALASDSVGDYTRQVMDFWRPLYSKYAFADGHYSIECYLEALSGAWSATRSLVDDVRLMMIRELEACFYHVPFVTMARKAHVRHWRLDQNGACAETADDALILESYQRRVAPWLTLNSRIGNIYTGSLFLALIDYLRSLAPAIDRRSFSIFSYGSGCGAAFCLGHVVPGAEDYAQQLDPEPDLLRRRRLTVNDYETVLAAADSADLNETQGLDPAAWGLTGNCFYTGTRNHIRQYTPC